MYSEQDFNDVMKQLKKRNWQVGGVMLVLTAGMLAAFFARPQTLNVSSWYQIITIALCILLCSAGIFGYCMLIAPVRAYARHIHHALEGRTRNLTGTYMSMESESTAREGVYFYPFIISVGDGTKPEDERLFYMDANLPRPDWKQGDTLTVTSYDNRVTAWVKA